LDNQLGLASVQCQHGYVLGLDAVIEQVLELHLDRVDICEVLQRIARFLESNVALNKDPNEEQRASA